MIMPDGPPREDMFSHMVDDGSEIKESYNFSAIDRRKESTIRFIKMYDIEIIAEFIMNLMDSHDGLLKNYEELIKLWQLENEKLTRFISP